MKLYSTTRLQFAVTSFLFLSLCSSAQTVSQPPNGENNRCIVTQYIGSLVNVTVTYNSPNVTGPNGEDRKGKIWGKLVPYGYVDQGFGTSKAAPWRAGSNEIRPSVFHMMFWYRVNHSKPVPMDFSLHQRKMDLGH